MTTRPIVLLLLLLLACPALVPATAVAANPPSASERLRAAGEELAAYELQHSLGVRLRKGLPIEQLPDMTPAGAVRDADFYGGLVKGLADLDERQLAEEEVVSLAVLRHLAQDAIAAQRFADRATPVTPYASPLTYVQQAFATQPLASVDDRRRYQALLEKLAIWIGSLETLLRDQAKRGLVLAAPEIPLAVGRWSATQRPAASSPFAVSAERLAALDEPTRVAFVRNVEAAVETRVNPALASLIGYLGGEYAQHAPAGVGQGRYSGGAEYYRYLVRYHTTLDTTPEEVHAIGLAEMERITKALDGVRQQVPFAGDLAAFRKFLRTDARFFAKAPEELGQRLLTNQARILPRIHEFFGRTPKAPSGVERLAAALEGSMTFGYYDPPNPSRDQGLYYYNGSQLDQRSLLTSAALVAHELVPGHHFQIALQRENTNLPEYRQNYTTTAFVEGWGEYASDLAGQMGMYTDPYDLAGRLMMDAHLSARLVVDTGMNALGWSRERAMQYLTDHTLLSTAEVATETLRYACDIPGQALAYKMGMRKLVELREHARTALGARFDIRAFHDLVLGGGALPLPVLEQRVERWIAASANP
jgi:uncharacterized protein (DUF885 family)